VDVSASQGRASASRGRVSAGDEALLRAARAGDREAFELIVHRHGPAMHNYARRMLADAGEAQEVVQDAFVAAWRGLDHYRGESRLRTWLISLTAHKAVDSYRRSRAVPVDDALLVPLASGPAQDPHAHATQGEFLAALNDALAELPHHQRACWVLREVHGLSAAEVGKALDLSPGAVRGQVGRAQRALSERMVRWR